MENENEIHSKFLLSEKMFSMSVANQRSTPVGAKVNGSQNRVKKRYFATLSMTGSAGSTAISLP